jgi:NodT family efflux transporter outer membrane factor (OMF) lipoprotein
MRRSLIALFALAPSLAACALGPKVPAPNVALPAAYEAPSPATQGPADLDRWWTAYDDPQLSGLIEAALVSAPDARAADARLAEALAIRSSALAAFRPQGDIEGSATRTDTKLLSGGTFDFPGAPPVSFTNAGVTTNKAVNFDVSWELDLFGRSFATRRKANADLAAAQFDAAASRASLAANVADSLFQARGLAIQLEDARETARIDADLARIARAKADHGLGTTADADQAESETAQAQAAAADLESQLHAARRTLLVLVGRGTDPLENLPVPASAGAPPTVPASVPGALLARRPDVREAAARLRSAAGQLKLDELALFPKFTLLPGVGLTSSTGGISPATTSAWSIGLGLAVPVLDQPRLRSEIRAQGARVDQAVIAYEQAVQTAYGEADNALVGLGSDENRIRLLTAAEAQARSAYEASRKGYAAGIDDLTTALSAERTWRTARSALSGARVEALRRSVQAFKALGGGWTPAPLILAETKAAAETRALAEASTRK